MKPTISEDIRKNWPIVSFLIILIFWLGYNYYLITATQALAQTNSEVIRSILENSNKTGTNIYLICDKLSLKCKE